MLKKFQNNKVLLIISIINILAGLFAFQYYFSQFSQTNPFFWIFVADCPLYALLFGLMLFGKTFKKENKYFSAIVFFGAIKYSLWTLFVLFISGHLFSMTLITIVHLLFLFEAILLLKPFELKPIFIVTSWFLINDFMDYVFVLHPYILPEKIFISGLFALVLTIIIPIFLLNPRPYKAFLF